MPKTAKLPKHCQPWKNGLRVRIGVPEELRTLVGKSELRRSLGTSDPREAEYTRLPIIAEFESIIETARLQLIAERAQDAENNNPVRLARRITAPLSYRHGTTRGELGMMAGFAALPAGADHAAVRQLVDERIAAFYSRNDQVASLLRQIEDRLPETFAADQIIASLPIADASEVISFESILAAWSSRQSNPDTLADYRAKLATFGGFLLGKVITKPLTEAEKAEYLATADAANVSAQDAVAYLDLLVKTKKAKTADNHFAALKAVFSFNAKPGRALKANPFAGIETGLKSDPKDKRLPFEAAERATLLIAANESADPVVKFAALIAGFSGARLSEIVEAAPRDVEMVDGVTVLHIRETYRGKNRTVKNDGATVRTIPLHSSFAAEFLAYAQSRKGGELFPSLKADANNGLTDDASDKLNKFIRTTLGYTDSRKVFHSFRHTVATMLANLRPRVAKELRFYITGHAMAKGEGDAYIHANREPSGEEIRELLAVIERLPS